MSQSDAVGEPERESAEKAAEKSEAREEPKALSAEEQMALYEESLKEDDWGHQPC